MKLANRLAITLGVITLAGSARLSALPEEASGKPQKKAKSSAVRSSPHPESQTVASRTQADPSAGVASTATSTAAAHHSDASKDRGSVERPSPTPQASIGQIITHLRGMQSKSEFNPEQRKQLGADLMALARGTLRPSQAGVDALATSLSKARVEGEIRDIEQAKLANDISAILNSADAPVSEVMAVIRDAQGILTSAGAPKPEAQAVASDLLAISIELKKGAQSAAGRTEEVREAALMNAGEVRDAKAAAIIVQEIKARAKVAE